ncbi:TVP38/TMEM64 family protein [Klebsiella sp. BIGb0407]|uniref:TVP38/TMEM64 family protein n=1 Tax=Klebsiella sp. BIGb0407 TaxID=2940603 RepID=UPI0021676316|nr:VTT domain-containing protein [Klebsiella sp. BIGb0407]MCS3429577.1 putative membrane protein YdjX (TVP38/TMEM64 family) [Klebsiella sp. BIGb0407]
MTRSLVLVLFVVLFVVIYISLPPGTLSLATLQHYQGQLKLWQADNPKATIGLFFLGYFLISALSIPGTRILALLGGALFGLLEGTVLVASAATSGAVIAMLLSRYLLRDWVQRRFITVMDKVNTGMARNGSYYLFAVRLVPVLPFSVINLLMGLTPFPVMRFAVITLVGLLPSIVLYISTGRELSQIQSVQDILSPSILLLFVLLGSLPLISRWILKSVNK